MKPLFITVQGHNSPPADIHIVIDVVRAFTVSHLAFIQGAKEIYLTRTPEEAHALRHRMKHAVLIGELRGTAPQGFDFGNSPVEISKAKLHGKILIHRTGNGTQAALGASHSSQVAVTGFSNARATAVWARRLIDAGAKHVCFVASDRNSDDDLACADFIQTLIERDMAHIDASVFIDRILKSEAAQKVRTNPHLDAKDLDYCIAEAKPQFVMTVDFSDVAKVVRCDL